MKVRGKRGLDGRQRGRHGNHKACDKYGAERRSKVPSRRELRTIMYRLKRTGSASSAPDSVAENISSEAERQARRRGLTADARKRAARQPQVLSWG